MTSERIKEIQEQTAYPESVSVMLALKQVWNECEQEQLAIQRVSQRSELYFAFMEEYNALMGEGEHQILKEEVVVLLAKYCG